MIFQNSPNTQNASWEDKQVVVANDASKWANKAWCVPASRRSTKIAHHDFINFDRKNGILDDSEKTKSWMLDEWSWPQTPKDVLAAGLCERWVFRVLANQKPPKYEVRISERYPCDDEKKIVKLLVRWRSGDSEFDAYTIRVLFGVSIVLTRLQALIFGDFYRYEYRSSRETSTRTPVLRTE